MSIPSPDLHDDWQSWASAVKQELEKKVSYAPRESVGKLASFKIGALMDGYLLCNGSTFSGASYPALEQLLGSTTLPSFSSSIPGCVIGIKT